VSELNSQDELSPEASQTSAEDAASPAREDLAAAEDASAAEDSPAEDSPAPEDAAATEDRQPAESVPAPREVAGEQAAGEEAASGESPGEEAAASVEDSPAEESPAAEEAPVANKAVAAEETVAAEQSPAAGQAAAAEPADGGQNGRQIGIPGMDWYIIHTYSGFENKVKESLRSRAQAFGFGERVGEILIPTEDVVVMRGGKKVTSKRMLYPGYVLVQLDMDDELWHVVKNTPRVTGFVGGGQAPTPLTADEVNQTLYRQKTSADKPRPKMTFEKNDRVKIVDGPFANFSGSVEEVNEDRNTLKVMVTIFGRGTPVELEYFQVEKEGG
jgi:transcriptional antiterminator NusG